jgi:hypothetical protein
MAGRGQPLVVRTRSAWGLMTLLACGVATPATVAVRSPVPEATTPRTPTSTPPARPDARALLAARGVYHEDFARPVLYSWTTATQAAALRETRRLLVAEAGVGLPSPFLRGLEVVAGGGGAGHELARVLLEHPQLRRRRYAWPSPFATTMGLGPVRYGDALIRVEIDPRAVIVRFRPGDAEPLIAVDMSGRSVALAGLDPTRIAAVYHVRDGPREQIGFREYVLCNESMIREWSIATPEIRAQVDADIALLEQLADGALAVLPDAAVRASATPTWQTARPGAPAIDHWHASLAFDNVRYRPSRNNLAAIVAALRNYDGSGEPVSVGQTAQASQTSR